MIGAARQLDAGTGRSAPGRGTLLLGALAWSALAAAVVVGEIGRV